MNFKLTDASQTIDPGRGRPSLICKPILDSFLAMNISRAKIENTERKLYSSLYGYLRLNPDIPVKVQSRDNELFLVRTDFIEHANIIVNPAAE